jgi:fucose 4-O-acetylase-like acetyltransferase
VFISGYVFGFQVRQKGAQLLSMNAIVRSKLKRLLLPSIVFSIIYLLIFGLKDGESIAQACYSIIDGRGHMWFLPMLFWCFIYIAFVEKFDFRTRTVVIAAFTCSFLSFLPLPFRMGSALYYFPFFYVGYAIRHKELKISNIAPPQKKQKHTNNQRFIHYKFLCFNMDSNHVFCRFKNLQYTNSAVQTYLFYVWRCNDLRYLQTAFNERKYSTNNS